MMKLKVNVKLLILLNGCDLCGKSSECDSTETETITTFYDYRVSNFGIIPVIIVIIKIINVGK